MKVIKAAAGVLLLAALVLAPTGAAKEYVNGPDHGHFVLEGTAQIAQDPENSANDVVQIRTDQSPFYGLVGRDLKSVPISTLDNELEFKSYFVAPRTCSAGIPRMTLLVDADGDGDWQQYPASPDFAAHGHINPPSFTGCLMSMWRYDDLTDNQQRWEITPCGAAPPGVTCPFPYNAWDSFESAVTTGFPFHSVCTGYVVDADEGSPGQSGTAYYDLISIGGSTWSNRHDSHGHDLKVKCKRTHH